MQIVTKHFILICYVNHSLDLRLKGHIGDSSDKFALSLDSDTDFAGDKIHQNPLQEYVWPSQARTPSFH